MLSLTIGSSDFWSFSGSGLASRGDFFNIFNRFWAGFFGSSSNFLLGMSTKLFRMFFGVASGEELNSSSYTSFSGESACILAKRFLRAAAIMAAVSPGMGDLGLDLTGVPPGDLQKKVGALNEVYSTT